MGFKYFIKIIVFCLNRIYTTHKQTAMEPIGSKLKGLTVPDRELPSSYNRFKDLKPRLLVLSFIQIDAFHVQILQL